MKAYKKSILIFALSLTAVSFYSFTDQFSDRYFEIAKSMDIYATLFREVNTYYVDEINPSQLMKTGIDAMLASLDPYTNYISEDQIEDFRTMTTGQYGGIGAIVGKRNGEIVVIEPYAGDPADVAGIKSGDIIIKVDDIDVNDKSTDDISKLLKGQANTSINLTIKRFNEEEPIEITVNREKIKIENIPYHGMLNDEVGYMRLTDFSIGAYGDVRLAFESLQKKGMKKLIFDLRDNPGGSLTEAIKICSIFLPNGSLVVETKGKFKKNNSTYKTLNPPLDTANVPLIVLTNESSASASEIVAGVMQDYDRGVLIGRRTFGKGLVQMTRPLVYNAQVKITTSRYYIPSGRCIQAIDYSQKIGQDKEDDLPDSLRAKFETQAGRLVYDGKGIKPDFNVENETYAQISVSLLRQNLIFDYATQYYYGHDSIAAPEKFSLSDKEYEAFTNWLQDKDYDYTTSVEKAIEDLISKSKEEKYYAAIQDEIESLRSQVSHNKDSDLKNFEEEIKSLLEAEIISRYYYKEGVVKASFNEDNDVKKALDVLSKTELYESTLTARN